MALSLHHALFEDFVGAVKSGISTAVWIGLFTAEIPGLVETEGKLNVGIH